MLPIHKLPFTYVGPLFPDKKHLHQAGIANRMSPQKIMERYGLAWLSTLDPDFDSKLNAVPPKFGTRVDNVHHIHGLVSAYAVGVVESSVVFDSDTRGRAVVDRTRRGFIAWYQNDTVEVAVLFTTELQAIEFCEAIYEYGLQDAV